MYLYVAHFEGWIKGFRRAGFLVVNKDLIVSQLQRILAILPQQSTQSMQRLGLGGGKFPSSFRPYCMDTQ